jgi:hypothetical protein
MINKNRLIANSIREEIYTIVKFVVISLICFALSEEILSAWGKNAGAFHTLLEVYCIFIAVIIFILTFISYEELPRENKIIGIGFLAVAIFGIFHIMTFPALKVYSIEYHDLSLEALNIQL